MTHYDRPARGRFLRWFAIAIGVAVIPFLYRAAVVYEWRPGRCATAALIPTIIQGDASRADAADPMIRVVSWNIGGHSALLDDDYIREVADVIVGLDGDVFALQEVHRGTWQARFDDQVSELAVRTGMTALYAPSFSTPEGDYGNLILTRGRVVDASRIDLAGIGEPRAVLTATLQIRRQLVTFASTHLSAWGPLNRRWREAQAQCVARSLGGTPTILAGDLNVVPGSTELEPLFRSGWTDTDPLGVPTHNVMHSKLDYVLIPPGFRTHTVRVHDAPVSDHKPLVAELLREVI